MQWTIWHAHAIYNWVLLRATNGRDSEEIQYYREQKVWAIDYQYASLQERHWNSVTRRHKHIHHPIVCSKHLLLRIEAAHVLGRDCRRFLVSRGGGWGLAARTHTEKQEQASYHHTTHNSTTLCTTTNTAFPFQPHFISYIKNLTIIIRYCLLASIIPAIKRNWSMAQR
jgi:hypothetical protein